MHSKIQNTMKTRPDTWPIPVADEWAGAEMHVFTLFTMTDGRTNGRTDQRTDKASYRVACPQLKRSIESMILALKQDKKHEFSLIRSPLECSFWV